MNLIITTLKQFPELNIRGVAALLRVSETVVAEAQRNYYKKFIPVKSELWDLPNYGK